MCTSVCVCVGDGTKGHHLVRSWANSPDAYSYPWRPN